ncbi:MAG: hypothetical protein WCG32_03445 [Actinomycetes bacterium]
MPYRINKAQPVTWRDPNTLQIGLGAASIKLDELTLEQQKIVDALYSGVVSGQELAVDSSINAPSGETARLISRLEPMLEQEPPKQIDVFGPWQQLAFAEMARASVDYEVNGEMVLAERWQRNIHIDQLDKTGWLITRALLASGIGTMLTHDAGKVLQTDLGELGYPKEKLNLPRAIVAVEEVENFSLAKSAKARLLLLPMPPKQDLKVSFAIVVGHLALDPTKYARWTNRDVPHIAIIFALDAIEISPIIQPGITGCLNCYQQTKIDEDSSWPIIASQLLELPRMRDDSASLLTSTGLAAKLILRFLDIEAGFEIKNENIDLALGYRINQLHGSITRVKYDFHPECNCQSVG